MEKKILKQLKSDYERLEISPSEDLWDRLDQKLDATPEIALKRPFQWWKYAAVVLLMISVGTVIYYNKYHSRFDYKKTDYIVKKTLGKEAHPVNSDLQPPSVISNDEPAGEPKIVNENHGKNNPDQVVISQEEKKRPVIQVAEHKEQLDAFNQSGNTIINQGSIEDKSLPNSPVIAQVKKSNYINPDELLLGRELDKAREKVNKEDRKLGAFKFDKIVPNVGNVTVLGVTVYLESK